MGKFFSFQHAELLIDFLLSNYLMMLVNCVIYDLQNTGMVV